MGHRRSSRAVLFAILLAATVVGTAHPAAACSCATLSTSESFDNADVVFTGDLIEVRTPSGDTFSSADPERFVFDVDQVYKGETMARQSVVTPREGGSCGLELVGRGPFLVFASTEPTFDLSGEAGELYSHLCTGSRSLAEAGVPTAYGAGSQPTAGASAIGSLDDGSRAILPVDDGGRPIVPIAVATGGVLALAGGILLVRRARQP
jgi:hypothetical protein